MRKTINKKMHAYNFFFFLSENGPELKQFVIIAKSQQNIFTLQLKIFSARIAHFLR